MSREERIEKLLHGNDEERQRAAECFVGTSEKEVTDEDVQLMIECLADPYGEVAETAARALRDFRRKEAVLPLLKVFENPTNRLLNAQLRWNASEAIGAILEKHRDPDLIGKSLPFLLQELNERGQINREKAAKALGKIKDERAVESLFKALLKGMGNDFNAIHWVLLEWDSSFIPEVVEWIRSRERCSEIKLVNDNILEGYLGNPEVAPKLVASLADYFYANRDEKEMIRKVNFALKQIGAPAAKALCDAFKENDYPHVSNAKAAMVNLGAVAVPELISVLMEPALASREDIRIRKAAIECLRKIPHPSAIPVLIAEIRKRRSYTHEACYALAAIGKPALPHLIEEAKSKDAYIRREVYVGLGMTRDERAIETLKKGLSDPDRDARHSALNALEIIGGEKSILAMMEGAKETPDTGTKGDIAEKVGELKVREAVPLLLELIGTRWSENAHYVCGKSYTALVNIGAQNLAELKMLRTAARKFYSEHAEANREGKLEENKIAFRFVYSKWSTQLSKRAREHKERMNVPLAFRRPSHIKPDDIKRIRRVNL